MCLYFNSFTKDAHSPGQIYIEMKFTSVDEKSRARNIALKVLSVGVLFDQVCASKLIFLFDSNENEKIFESSGFA